MLTTEDKVGESDIDAQTFEEVAELQSNLLLSTYKLAKGGLSPYEVGVIIASRYYSEKVILSLGVTGDNLQNYKSSIREYALGQMEVDQLNRVSEEFFHSLLHNRYILHANEGKQVAFARSPNSVDETSPKADDINNEFLDPGELTNFIESTFIGCDFQYVSNGERVSLILVPKSVNATSNNVDNFNGGIVKLLDASMFVEQSSIGCDFQYTNGGKGITLIQSPSRCIVILLTTDNLLVDNVKPDEVIQFIEYNSLGWMLHHQVLIFFYTTLPLMRDTFQINEQNLENLQLDLRDSAKRLMYRGASSVNIEDFEESVSAMAPKAFVIAGRTRVKRKRVPSKVVLDFNLLMDNLLEENTLKLRQQMRGWYSNQRMVDEIGIRRFEQLLIGAYEIELRETFTKYSNGRMNWHGFKNEYDKQNLTEKTEISKRGRESEWRSVISRFVSRLEESFFSMFRL